MNLRVGVSILIAMALVAAVHGPAPRFDGWKILGPGGGGAMYQPTVSPHDPNLVLEHCDMTGSYISHDAGRSWRMFNLQGTVGAFAFDPRDPQVLYAGNHALYRSDDAGRTWKMIFPDPGRNTVEHMVGDHAEVQVTTDDPVYPANSRIHQIAVDPADSRRIYVMFGGRGRGAAWLCYSSDGGGHWSRLKDFGEPVALLYFDGGLRVVASSGVFAQEAGEWKRGEAPTDAPIISASGGEGLLYATAGGNIFMSDDRGATWRAAKEPYPGAPKFTLVACSARQPRTAYVAMGRLTGVRSAILKTTDGGAHWSPVYLSKGRSAPNVEDGWIEEHFGGTDDVVGLGVAPGNPDICYATDLCPRTFRTLDGGKTWQQVVSERVEGNRWTTTGFDVTTCYGVHFDPFRPRTMFISYTDIGLFKSEDGGVSWRSSIAGISRRWRNTTYWVEFDPKVQGLMWGAFARTHDLPRPKMWRRENPDAFAGGVATSTDAGDHWTVTNKGMPETAVTHVVLDPASPMGARTLYACGFGRGVYKSVDNGQTWALKIAGIEERQPFAWRIARADDGVLYLVVARRTEDGGGKEGRGALYKSIDGAEHWSRLNLPSGVTGPTGLALDRGRVYLAAWGPPRGGVFASDDGVATWRNIFDGTQHVYDVTVDPKNPDVLYNCGFESGAWRSNDRGKTWGRIKDFDFRWGHRVIPDPADADKVYITTFGGSAWHGRSDIGPPE